MYLGVYFHSLSPNYPLNQYHVRPPGGVLIQRSSIQLFYLVNIHNVSVITLIPA